MNLYFLVEGRRTERKVYPAWLKELVPELLLVDDPSDLSDFGYVIFSGEGYPSLIDVHLPNAIKDYRASGKFDVLVVCLDVDDSDPDSRAIEVIEKATSLGFPVENLRVIPQESCIETWFLGNRRIVPRNPQSRELREYLHFHDVRTSDPETMEVHPSFNTRSIFHSRYFKLLSIEKHFRYTKQNPRHVTDSVFLNELISRRTETNHLATFGIFLDVCDEIQGHAPSPKG